MKMSFCSILLKRGYDASPLVMSRRLNTQIVAPVRTMKYNAISPPAVQGPRVVPGDSPPNMPELSRLAFRTLRTIAEGK